MMSPQQTGKELKKLARDVWSTVANNSAGEGGRRRNWNFFVKNLPSNYPLMELADECFYTMSEDQQAQFLAKHAPKEAPRQSRLR